MKRALKYGLLVAVIIAVWIALKHWGLHLDQTRAAIFDTVVFNVAGIIVLALGISDKRAANNGGLTFGEGMKTGVAIAITYAVLTAIFFALVLVLVGPGLMQQAGHVGPNGEITGPILVKAFAGLIIGLAFIGTILSVFVTLILKRRL
ncbi:MAG: hypothetical protein QOD75_283 [Blastocatellia bacterium]|jgi:hypothetical protein|nr:hypothetical protein [Blastocatellia bacterium]